MNSVSFAYDNANRRTSLTLPNGIVVRYSYYVDSHLKDLTWTQSGGTQIGNLHYTYDAAGRVTGKSGTMANTNLPTAIVVPNTFNADNEMTSFNGQPMTYDAGVKNAANVDPVQKLVPLLGSIQGINTVSTSGTHWHN
jgi:YD repeat-containing protein